MKKVKILMISAILIVIAIMLTGCSALREDNRRNDFLENMVDVSYIKLNGPYVEKRLDAKLAELLNQIDNDSIDTETSSAKYEIKFNKGETGVQANSFIFYDKNGNKLYNINYYGNDDYIIIYRVNEKSKIEEPHTIENDDVLKYVKSVIK